MIFIDYLNAQRQMADAAIAVTRRSDEPGSYEKRKKLITIAETLDHVLLAYETFDDEHADSRR